MGPGGVIQLVTAALEHWCVRQHGFFQGTFEDSLILSLILSCGVEDCLRGHRGVSRLGGVGWSV